MLVCKGITNNFGGNDMTKRTGIATFLSALLAGICIALGGTIFLRLKDTFPGSNVAGTFLFAIGLMTICARGYNLFTGKACYLLEQKNKPAYLLFLLVVWLGNLCGTCLLAVIERLTGIGDGISQTARSMVESKLSTGLFSLFLLGIICNICIFIAVDGFKNNPHQLGKYLSLFLGVMVFILCGTEHSVADMYYWAVSGILVEAPAQSFLRLAVISLGNACGALLLPGMELLIKKLNA